MVLPSFTTKLGGEDSVTSLCMGCMEIEKIIFQSKKHVSPKAGEIKRKWSDNTVKIRNIWVKNLNLVLAGKAKK